MQQINLDPVTVIQAVFGGKTYDLKKPKIGQVRMFEKAYSEGDSVAKTDAMLSFISACGLPAEVIDELDVDGLNAVTEALMPKKKA